MKKNSEQNIPLKKLQSQQLGRAGENVASALLKEQGLREIVRNWRQGRYELDIVCQEGAMLVFVEVRTRTAQSMTSPLESLTPTKMRHFLTAARLYMQATKQWNSPCRFDVVCVTACGKILHAEHYRNVCQFSDFMDCSHTSWQPW